MAIRNIYLKIEEVLDYSPVEPSGHAAANYRRDCMRNPGHEDATIPLSEVDARPWCPNLETLLRGGDRIVRMVWIDKNALLSWIN